MDKKNELYLIIQFFITIIYTVASIVLISYKSNYETLRLLFDIGIILFFVMSIVGLIQYLIVYKSRTGSAANINKFKDIFNSLNESIIIFDNSFTVAFVSDNITNLIGLTRNEILTEPIYTSDGINITEEILSEIKFPDKIFPHHNVKFYNKETGEEVDVDINVKQIQFIDSKWYCIVINDLTNQIAEEKRFADELANAIESGKEKSIFLSRVSHEIRTPLNGIIGMNEIAKENLNNKNYEQLSDVLDKIDFSSKYLLSIIENVLSMSRLEAGRVVVENKTLSINSLISEIETVISTQVNNKHQELQVLTNFDSLYVLGDETKLTQILVNIIGNSVKYTDDGGKILFKVNAEEKINNKVELIFEIKDNGIGMSEEFAKRMFEPFSQEGKKVGVPGTGLGLAITKNLITLLNGSIKVESKEGEGTTTIITFLFDQVASSNNQVIKAKDYELIDFSKYRVLVAEDNNINVIVIRNHLEHFKFNVEIAEDGLEAVYMYKNNIENYYDFILMDIHMPNMDGYEATKEIRESGRGDSNIPIIALTADALKEDISKALINKMNDHISKPIIREKMIETIYLTLLKAKKIKYKA